jgi:hypothetical protein
MFIPHSALNHAPVKRNIYFGLEAYSGPPILKENEICAQTPDGQFIFQAGDRLYKTTTEEERQSVEKIHLEYSTQREIATNSMQELDKVWTKSDSARNDMAVRDTLSEQYKKLNNNRDELNKSRAELSLQLKEALLSCQIAKRKLQSLVRERGKQPVTTTKNSSAILRNLFKNK